MAQLCIDFPCCVPECHGQHSWFGFSLSICWRNFELLRVFHSDLGKFEFSKYTVQGYKIKYRVWSTIEGFFIFFISSYTCDQSFCLHPSTDRWEWKEAESCPEKQVEVNNFRNKWNIIYFELRFICLFVQFCSAEMTDLCSWPMGFLFNTVYKKYMCMTQTHSICYNLWVLHLSDGKQCERITASAVKTEQNRKAVLSIRRIGK